MRDVPAEYADQFRRMLNTDAVPEHVEVAFWEQRQLADRIGAPLLDANHLALIILLADLKKHVGAEFAEPPKATEEDDVPPERKQASGTVPSQLSRGQIVYDGSGKVYQVMRAPAGNHKTVNVMSSGETTAESVNIDELFLNPPEPVGAE